MRVRGGLPDLGGALRQLCGGEERTDGYAGVIGRLGDQDGTPNSIRRGLETMTRERMQAMTQHRDGISLAPEEAAGVSGVASRFSVMAAILAIASLIAGSAGTSYAHKKNPSDIVTLDTVVVTNYGAAFSGSVSTYLAGSGKKARPNLQVKGTNTGLGNSSGAAHDSVSSADGHIAVAVPFDNFGGVDFGGDISGCGPFGVANLFGPGMVEIYSPGATGNSKPENIICSPFFAEAFKAGVTTTNVTGIFAPQGVAFESPFDGVHPGMDVLAVGNLFPLFTQDSAICAGLGLSPTSLGSITEYDVAGLPPFTGSPASVNNIPPLNNSPAAALNVLTAPNVAYTQNATIAGCFSSLAGPEALAFDESGHLFVVNNVGLLVDPTPPGATGHIPRFLSVFRPDAFGDVLPQAIIGVLPPFTGCTTCPPAGFLLSPVGVTVESAANFANDVAFVTDQSNNSIQVIRPFRNFNPAAFIFQGQLIATIQGGATHLKSPEGVALGLHVDNNTLYVVNQMTNTLEMFTDIDATVAGGGGNVPPTLILSNKQNKLLQPVGVAEPEFTPSASETPPPGVTAASE